MKMMKMKVGKHCSISKNNQNKIKIQTKIIKNNEKHQNFKYIINYSKFIIKL